MSVPTEAVMKRAVKKTAKRKALTASQRNTLTRKRASIALEQERTRAYKERRAAQIESQLGAQGSMLVNRNEAFKANRQARNEADIARKKQLQELDKPSATARIGKTFATGSAGTTEQVQEGSTSIIGIIFRILVVLIGMAIIYSLVRDGGSRGSKFINITGKALTNVTSGQPMFVSTGK